MSLLPRRSLQSASIREWANMLPPQVRNARRARVRTPARGRAVVVCGCRSSHPPGAQTETPGDALAVRLWLGVRLRRRLTDEKAHDAQRFSRPALYPGPPIV